MNDEIDNILKINPDDGDVLFVTLPDIKLPRSKLEEYMKNVGDKVSMMFSDKDVEVLVAPFGTKIELIKSSSLKDK